MEDNEETTSERKIVSPISNRPLTSEHSRELGFPFDNMLANNLTLLRAAVLNQDFDACILVDGGEGYGKSVLAQQIAYFLDVERKLDLDTQMCYYNEQFKKAVLSLKPGKAIIWDEARRGLNSRRSMSNINLDITDMLAECRQHNLFLIIVMPTFYDMDKNIAIWRSRLLIHVWGVWDTSKPDKPLKRGYFRLYSEAGKKDLRTDTNACRGYRYPFLPGRSANGRFVKHYVVDEAEYRRKKREAEDHYRAEKEKKKPKKEAPQKSEPEKTPEIDIEKLDIPIKKVSYGVY